MAKRTMVKMNKPTAISPQQRVALDIKSNIWVTASAGSGKTTVLVARIIALMLAGNRPERILALTYTRAAAAEMKARIIEKATFLATAPDETCQAWLEEISALKAGEQSEKLIKKARTLYRTLLDADLKIMTFHGFCQSILTRFPLEASLPPRLAPIEGDEARELMARARGGVLTAMEYQPVIERLSRFMNIETFDEQMNALAEQRRILTERLKNIPKTSEAIADFLSKQKIIDIAPDRTVKAIEKDMAEGADKEKIAALIKAIRSHGTEPEKNKLNETLARFQQQTDAWQFLLGFFMKKTDMGAPLKKLGTKKVRENNDWVTDYIPAEQNRLASLWQDRQKAIALAVNADLLAIGFACMEGYQKLKRDEARIDYADMIETTLKLLTDAPRKAPWVLYRLDGGLDHILIDEAQDTNPAQWEILEILAEEFFGEKGLNKDPRTFFAVGDVKQSIYGFQGANARTFVKIAEQLKKRCEEAEALWNQVVLNNSFRSAPAILRGVDAVFGAEENRKAVLAESPGEEKISHESAKPGMQGSVELWPVREGGVAEFSHFLADKIEAILSAGEILPSTGKTVAPGDIMVLLKARTDGLAGRLSRDLAERNIKTAGIDRLKLGGHIAIKDLLAFARFLLLPEDDLSLACLLKSPFIGMDEQRLIALALNRPKGESLWARLSQLTAEKTVADFLNNLLKRVDFISPARLFSHLLYKPCPAGIGAGTGRQNGFQMAVARLGADVVDVIDEFMRLVYDFEGKQAGLLEQFLHDFSRKTAEIKRETSQNDKEFVQIVTIHGAKGLEAPIVIIPHLMKKRIKSQSESLIDHDGFPIFQKSSFRYSELQDSVDIKKQEDDDESRRLLYVAMTRAKDRLYMGGYVPKKNGGDSWYEILEKPFKDEAVEREGSFFIEDSPQARKTEIDAPTPGKKPPASLAIPAWLYHTENAQQEHPIRLRSLAPGLSPSRRRGDDEALLRGQVIHALLPRIRKEHCEAEEIARLLALEMPSMPSPQCDFWAGAIKKCLNLHGESPFFSEKAQSELSLAGFLPVEKTRKEFFSGQIDLVQETESAVFITEFKTLLSPPENPEEIDLSLLRQLAGYWRLLQQAKGGKPCHAAFLWIANARLMPVSEDILANITLPAIEA